MLEGYESTFQQQKHDYNKITKPSKEEWGQLNLRLANYAQNGHKRLLLKKCGRLVWSRQRTCPVHLENLSKF
jgi:hypothetical protein